MATDIAYPFCDDGSGHSALPQLNIRHRGKVNSFLARTQMDTGEFRSRRRYTLQREVVNATLILTNSEMEFWRNWVTYTLSQGTLSFLIDLPLGGTLGGSGALAQKEVNIVGGVYSYQYLDFLSHRVTFALEFLDSSTISPDVFSVYSDLGDPSDPCESFDLGAFESATQFAEDEVAIVDNYTRNILPVHLT